MNWQLDKKTGFMALANWKSNWNFHCYSLVSSECKYPPWLLLNAIHDCQPLLALRISICHSRSPIILLFTANSNRLFLRYSRRSVFLCGATTHADVSWHPEGAAVVEGAASGSEEAPIQSSQPCGSGERWSASFTCEKLFWILNFEFLNQSWRWFYSKIKKAL